MDKQQDPENWQARLGAVISKLDEAIDTGAPGPAQRAMEIANQLLAEAVILDAKVAPVNRWRCGHCGYEGPCYGQPTSNGVSAPWCHRCGMNDKLERIDA